LDYDESSPSVDRDLSLLHLARFEATDHLRFTVDIRILTSWHASRLDRAKWMECFSSCRLSKLNRGDRTSKVMGAERELSLQRHHVIDVDQGVDTRQGSAFLQHSDQVLGRRDHFAIGSHRHMEFPKPAKNVVFGGVDVS
jgi:hypothetical protein